MKRIEKMMMATVKGFGYVCLAIAIVCFIAAIVLRRGDLVFEGALFVFLYKSIVSSVKEFDAKVTPEEE